MVVLILAAGVRLLGIGNTDLWGDEAFSVMLSVGPLSHMFAALSVAEPHPPLYPLLLAGWLRVLGRSEVIARVPSAFVGILSVAVAMDLARTFAPAKPRWLVAICPAVVGLLVALNPIQVWYSQEARMYEQTSFFAGLATLALLRLWQGKRGGATVYVLAVLGTTGSHYYGLFVPLAHLIAVLIASHRRRDLLRRWAVPTAISALLYLPWVFVALHVFTKYYGAQPGTVPLFSIALSSWVRVAAGWSLTWQHAELAALIVSALIVFGLAVPARSELDNFARLVLACWLFTPFIAGFLISLVRPMYAERYLVVSSLPMILLAGRGIIWLLTGAHALPSTFVSRSHLTMATLGAVALVVTLGAAIVPLENVWHGAYLKSAYNTHMREVDALSIAGDGVILDGISQTPLYDYYQKKLMPMYPLPDKLPLNPDETSGILDRIASERNGVWVFLYATPDYDPSYFIPRWLQSHAYLGFDQWAVNGRLQYYRFAAPATLTAKATNVRFGQSLLLTNYGWNSSGVPAGATIPVNLEWRWLSQPISQPRVALRLIDSSGFTWAQADQFIGGNFLTSSQWPTGTTSDDHHGLMIPFGTPPGSYRLILNVYGTGQSQPLSAQGDGATLGPEGMTIGQIQVNAAAKRIWPDGIAGYQSVGADFAGQVSLLGAAGNQSVKAGESGYLTLFWKALVVHPDLSKVRISLVDAHGQVAEQRDLPLATTGYPPPQWQVGDVLREQYHVPINARLVPGAYHVTAAPVDAAGKPIGNSATLGSLNVTAGPPIPPDVPPEYSLAATLGGAIALTGYDLAPAHLAPGATIALTLHWRDLAPLDTDYTVFVHVLDANQKVIAQHDQPPAGGQRPTSSWFPGDSVLDHYQLNLPATLPNGDYAIEVGLYNPADGKRLPVSIAGQSDGDRVIVTHFQVDR